MPFQMDAGIAAAFTPAAGTKSQTPLALPPRGDAIALRALLNTRMRLADAAEPDSPSVRTIDHAVPVADGEDWLGGTRRMPKRRVQRWCYFHGGGMVAGSVDLNDRLVSKYVAATGVPFLSVDYRLAPEYPGPAPVGDGCAALAWLVGRADEFGVDPKRIATMGDSAGGGVAAGVAIAARDAGISLARQILIYPMLDDRTVET